MLKEDLLKKLIKNNVGRLGIEINTSNELPELIEEELLNFNYTDFEIDEEYSTEKKELKIANAQQEVIDEIVYPAKGLFADNSEMGIAMTMLTTYSIDKKNDHDDFPDCNVMFIKKNILEDNQNEYEILDSSFRLF